MKKFFLSSIGFLCFYITTAQTSIYHPFVTPSKVVLETETLHVPASNVQYTKKASVEHLSRDSVINGLTYHLLERYDAWKIDNAPVPMGPFIDYYTNLLGFNQQLLGAIREDNKKVYYYNLNHSFSHTGLDTLFQQEYLLFDFNLEVGDSILRTALYHNTTAVDYYLHVVGVDSVLLDDMTYRKELLMKGTYSNGLITDTVCYSWVEGLGVSTAYCDAGLSPLRLGVLGGFELQYNPYASVSSPYVYPSVRCWSEIGTYLLSNSDYCDTLPGSLLLIDPLNQFETNINVVIAPNPLSTSSTITIKGLDNQSEILFELFDLRGQLVQTVTSNNVNELILRRGALPQGMYYYRISQSGQILDSNRLVIN